jgi:hypothetical protein
MAKGIAHRVKGNPMNALSKVLLLCRAEVLQLNYLTATLQNRSTAAHLNSMNPMNSTNSSNPLNKVLLLCRAEVLQLNYLTATLQNRSTAAREKCSAL